MANYIAELSKDVERKHVRYNNRYGLAIAADLYQAKAIDGSETHPAIIVGAPYGGVKEQGSCVYANELAKRGFVVLTFDQSFMGAVRRGAEESFVAGNLYGEFQRSGGLPWSQSPICGL